MHSVCYCTNDHYTLNALAYNKQVKGYLGLPDQSDDELRVGDDQLTLGQVGAQQEEPKGHHTWNDLKDMKKILT